MDTFTISKSLTSAHWIHDETTIVDLDFKTYNKQQILNRIQSWKSWFAQRKIQKLMLFDYTNLNSVSIFFACLELRIQIYTLSQPVNIDTTDVDLVMLGPTYKGFNNPNDPKFMMIDYKMMGEYSVEYQPTVMDLDFVCVIAKHAFSHTIYQQDIKTLYWATAGASESFEFYGKSYCGYPQINHIALISQSVTGPIFGGSKLYAIDHFHEMIMLASRGVIDSIGMFGSQLRSFMEFEKNQNLVKKNYKVALNNVEIITSGTSISPTVGDWVLHRGGKRIRLYYSDSNIMTPVFIQDIDSVNFDFLKRSVGKPCPFVKFRIDENNCLWVKNEIDSKIMQPIIDGWFKAADYIVEKNNQYLFKGRRRIDDKFLTDYEDIVFIEVDDGTVDYGDFLLTYDENSNTIVVNAFNLPLYDKLSNLQPTLISKMKKLGNISDVHVYYLDPSKGQKGTHG